MSEPKRKRIKYEKGYETGSREVKYELFVVPWRNAAEFRKVHENLFSHEVDKKRWALDQITVWQTHCFPSLPAAVEASYVLTSAIIQDIIWTNGFSYNQQLDIQNAYSSAITRFVNLSVECHKEYGTLSNVAKGLGIPSYIIDLRNEATHSFRPSVPCLRLAAEFAMQFLKTTYWDVEYDKVQNYVQVPIDTTDLATIAVEYINVKLQLMSEGSPSFKKGKMKHKEVSKETEAMHSKLRDILRKLDSYIKKDKRVFIKELIFEGVFIPSDEDLDKLLSRNEFLEFQKEDEMPEDPSLNLNVNIIPKLPDILETLWLEVIVLLHRHEALPLFLELLLKTQSSRTTVGQKLLLSWVISILRIHTHSRRFEKGVLKSIFKRRGMLVDWHHLFYASILNPCKYTPCVFPFILPHMDFNNHFINTYAFRFMVLMSILLGQATPEDLNLPKYEPLRTVEDLMREKKLMKAKKKNFGKGGKKSSSVENIWTRVSSNEIRSWPIGHVLNPIVEKESEEDDIDAFTGKEIIEEKFIYNYNENDDDDDNSVCSEGSDSKDPFSFDLEKSLQEIENRKSFLYRN